MRWVQTYHDGHPPDYADSAEECLRMAAVHGGERAALRAAADAEVDEDLAAELARWSDPVPPTTSLSDLADEEVLEAMDKIVAEVRRRGL